MGVYLYQIKRLIVRQEWRCWPPSSIKLANKHSSPGPEIPSRDLIEKLRSGSWCPKKEANKQNTTENATIVNYSVAATCLTAFSSFLSKSFPFLELGHTRKYYEELSLVIQVRSRMLGAFSHHLLELKPFTEAEELKS